MTIGVIGTDFRNSSLQFRELIYFDTDSKKQFLSDAKHASVIDECVVLSTCNRVEVYFRSSNLDEAMAWIYRRLAANNQLDESLLKSGLSFYADDDAIHHLFRVVSGLESMVLGEDEILGQVKIAYQLAVDFGQTGAYLNKLFQKSIRLGKRVREETAVSKGAYSVSSIAVDQIRLDCPEFFGQRILIVGTGTMAVRALKKLHVLGHNDITLTNRTRSSAERFIDQFDVSVISFELALHSLSDYDIVLMATGSKDPLCDQTHFPGTKPIYVVDLGMPRNVDPAVDSLDHVTIIPVDGLLEIANRNIDARRQAYEPIMGIINEESDDYLRWVRYRQESCVIVSA